MSRMPEYGTPDEESPEMTARDFALAIRRDGTPIDAIAYTRQRIQDAIDDLRRARGNASVDLAVSRMKDALGVLPPAE